MVTVGLGKALPDVAGVWAFPLGRAAPIGGVVVPPTGVVLRLRPAKRERGFISVLRFSRRLELQLCSWRREKQLCSWRRELQLCCWRRELQLCCWRRELQLCCWRRERVGMHPGLWAQAQGDMLIHAEVVAHPGLLEQGVRAQPPVLRIHISCLPTNGEAMRAQGGGSGWLSWGATDTSAAALAPSSVRRVSAAWLSASAC